MLDNYATPKTLLAAAAVVGGLTTLNYAAKLFRQHVIIPKYTVLNDLADLKTPRKGQKLKGQAIICSGRCAV